MTDVKICGLCRPQDVALAEDSGAAYLGMILSARGPRALDVAAADRVAGARRQARLVGVFVDEPLAAIARAAERFALDVVQLHGGESPDTIPALRGHTRARIWKALRVYDHDTAVRAIDHYADVVDGILLDGHLPGTFGGAGRTFDWEVAGDVRSLMPRGVKLIVAGGLTPDNVATAAAVLRPDVVDVSSGVEARPREKAPELVQAFIERARQGIPAKEQ